MRSFHCSGKVRSGCGIDSGRDWSDVESVLGYRAYPGTLNIKLTKRLPILKGNLIYDNFFECVPANVGGVDCHICGKYKLTNRRIVFVVAPIKLRDALNLKDGDDVEVFV